MVYNIHKDKTNLRKEILNKLLTQSEADKKIKNDLISDKIIGLQVFKNANVVMSYVSKEEEADTYRIMEQALNTGKTVAIPYSDIKTGRIIASEVKSFHEDLELSAYGIYQPNKERLKKIPLKSIDLVIVPGVAFDKNNNRLGRGKGYYDKFLNTLDSRAVTIGICFDFQLIESLPIEPNDVPVSGVITNKTV